MTFRPYPVLSVVCLIVLASLLWLGVWQLQRAEWKKGLIAEYAQQAEAPSVSWSEGVCPYLSGAGVGAVQPIEAAEIEARTADALPRAPFRVFGRSVSGVVGWRDFVAVDAGSCGADAGWILTQIGFEPESIGDMGPPPAEPLVRYTVTPWPDRPPMAGANAPENNQWYWLDPDLMAAGSVGERLNRQVILTPFAGTPSFLTRTPPVRHISYAITWFGLAICLLIVYLIVHSQTGRLSLRQRDQPNE